MPPQPLCGSLVGVAITTFADHRLRTSARCSRAISSSVAARWCEASPIGADGRMANEGRHVQAQPAASSMSMYCGIDSKSQRMPIAPQRINDYALDLGEIAHGQVAVGGPAGARS